MNIFRKEEKKCPQCYGLGNKTCSVCGGGGFNIYSLPVLGFPTPCPACGGRGQQMCIFCSGTGKVKI